MSPETIRNGVVYLVGLILSICVHEWGHAFAADKLGDPLPRSQGRVTLNPVAHIDPVGTILLPLIAFFTSITNPEIGARIMGWGKPVQISLSPRSISRKITLRTAHIIIAAAGPAMNIVFALLISAAYVSVLKWGPSESMKFVTILQNMILMNIGLAFFNLLPCPPLDGGALLVNLLPRRLSHWGELSERYGSILLFMLLMSGLLGYYMLPARYAGAIWIGLLTRLGLG